MYIHMCVYIYIYIYIYNCHVLSLLQSAGSFSTARAARAPNGGCRAALAAGATNTGVCEIYVFGLAWFMLFVVVV